MSGRFVILGLARTRRPWFSELARWSTSGSLPVEFVKCLTADEARAVLGSGRQLSLLLVDATTPGVDRELIALADDAGAPTAVVVDGRITRDWEGIGCVATLGDGFGPDELTALLEAHAERVEPDSRRPARARIDPEPGRSQVLAVTGPGGTGASSVAMAVAQSLARSREAGRVALVDGARRSDLAMYHDVGDVIPGLPELVDAHRLDEPDPNDIRRLLFRIEDRGYDLLLGMRHPRDWVAMRLHSLEASLRGLARSYDAVVVDHDPDLEGEAETGSVDVEDRNGVARATIASADLVLVVGTCGMKGVADLTRLVDTVAAAGVPTERILPVVNRTARRPVVRAETIRAIAHLLDAGGTAPPLFLSNVRNLEGLARSAAPMPGPLCNPIGRTVRRLLLELGSRARNSGDPQRIAAGHLGTHLDARTGVA